MPVALFWLLVQDGVTTFLETLPSFLFRNKNSGGSVSHLEPWVSGGCRAFGSLKEGGLT